MNKYPLIGGCIVAVVLLVSASLTNVVGYQAAQSSNQAIIYSDGNQKELLFQTIIDIANDKEIQNIVQKYDERTSVGGLLQGNLLGMNLGMPGRELRSLPVCTKAFLEFAYIMGTRLVRIYDASWIRSMLERYQGSNQLLQQVITSGIENNSVLANELSGLSEIHCDCEKVNITTRHPILCLLLFPIANFIQVLTFLYVLTGAYIPPLLEKLFYITINISISLNCFW